MVFKVTIERDEDIQALDLAQVGSAIDERSEALQAILNEAGPTLDHSKVKIVDLKDGNELSKQIRDRNAELTKLGDRRDVLSEADKARRNAEDEQRWSRRQSGDAPRWAPGAEAQNVRVRKNLGQLVTEDEDFKNWVKEGAPKGTGLNFQYADAWPSDFLAQVNNIRTLRNTLMETTAGWAPESTRIPGFVEAVTRPIQLLDIIPLARTDSEKIVYMEETTRTHNAAEKAEGAAFAESAFVFTEREVSIRKITDSLPATDEQLEDVSQVESYIDGRLMFGVRQRLDLQSLVGNGTAPNIRGIKNTSGIQTQAKGADPIPSAFFKAMTKVRVTGRALPTHLLIHPTNWESVRLLQTTDGAYVWGPPSEAGPERMWGLPVVQEDADSAGTGYVGSFQPAYISLYEKRGVDVQVGYIGDQFVQGKRTVRADMRAALVVFRPAAFSTVTGL